MTDMLIKPGGTQDVRAVKTLIFEPKAVDGLYTVAGYLPIYPVNGTTRGNQGGTFRVEPTQKVLDPSDILVMIQIRIYDARSGNLLKNGSKVKFTFHGLCCNYILFTITLVVRSGPSTAAPRVCSSPSSSPSVTDASPATTPTTP